MAFSGTLGVVDEDSGGVGDVEEEAGVFVEIEGGLVWTGG